MKSSIQAKLHAQCRRGLWKRRPLRFWCWRMNGNGGLNRRRDTIELAVMMGPTRGICPLEKQKKSRWGGSYYGNLSVGKAKKEPLGWAPLQFGRWEFSFFVYF